MILNQKESIKLVKKYNINIPKTSFVEDRKKILELSKKLSYPVVLKAYPKNVLHKYELGLIITGISNPGDLIKNYDKIIKKLGSKNKNSEILIQKQISGKEVIIGMKNDPSFGATIMFGLGGIFTEILKDVSFRVAPVSEKEAIAMIKEIKGNKILLGARGEKSVNLKSLSRTIKKISDFALQNKDIKSIDLNPVITNEKGAFAVDVKIIK